MSKTEKPKKKDSDLPETQPEGVEPPAFEPDENTLVPFDQFHDVLLQLEAAQTRVAELEEGNLTLDADLAKCQAIVRGLPAPAVVDPDQIETHHLNPSDLPSWVFAKPCTHSFTVDRSQFQSPAMAYAIEFAVSRGAKEGDIVHFCAGT